MKEIKEAYSKHGFDILGIASDDKETLAKFYKKEGALPWLSIVDEDSLIADRLNVEAFPTYFLIDEKGRHVDTPYGSNIISGKIAELLGVEKVEIKSKD